MSGHSKWATHKHGKAINDAKRSHIFSKVSRLIMVAAKLGGGDPAANPSLRLALEKAKEANMPKDNIERAIAKGMGVGSDNNYDEVTYEGYGPLGVAFLVKALTDNKNRTVSEIRLLFHKVGGSLGTAGSTSYIFANKDAPLFMVDIADEELAQKLTQFIDDLEDHDDVSEVFTNLNITATLDGE